MATLNDYKIVAAKSLRMYDFIGSNATNLDTVDKERLGFYHLIIENVLGIQNVDEIKEIITDVNYNLVVNNIPIANDFGIDAVYIDEESLIINLFNFKYREKYKPDSSIGENDISISAKY